MPKKIQKATDLKGLFIYHDEHHGTVYYDLITRNGYILTSRDVKGYTLSVSFIPLTAVVFYFCLHFKLNTIISVLIALGFYILLQAIYRITFLYKLPCVENYNIKKRKSLSENLMKNYSKQRLIVLVIFLVLLVGTMVAYILTSGFTGILVYALWAVTCATFIFLLIVISALIKKNK